MNFSDFCDLHCTTCRICYLRLLRPGDTVPFKKPKYILPLGVAEIMLAFVIIILDSLAIFSQSQGSTSPSPSFIGSPGIPIWLSIIFIVDGCIGVSAYKRKTRFSTAISFGVSCLSVLVTVVLLAIVTMAISEEATFQEKNNSPTGVVVSSMMSVLVIMLLIVTSASSLLCYVSLSSHDDRWFTDRGTQHDPPAPTDGQAGTAKLSVPSGQPAFLFYAPSNEAAKYSSSFSDVIKGMETRKAAKCVSAVEDEFYEETMDGRKTADLSEDGETYVPTAPSSAVRAKTLPDSYMTPSPPNV